MTDTVTPTAHEDQQLPADHPSKARRSNAQRQSDYRARKREQKEKGNTKEKNTLSLSVISLIQSTPTIGKDTPPNNLNPIPAAQDDAMPPQSPPKPETVTVTPDTHRNTETVTGAPNTVTPADGSSEDELAEIVGEHQEIVRRIVDDQLVRTNTPARARVCEVIGWLAAGETWRQITHKLAPLSRPMWRAWLMHYPRFRELAHAAEDCGESIRRQDRIDSAHAKAVDGWKETGKYGEIQRYDSRLHQLLLEADDPAKYRSRSQDAAQVQIGVLVSFSPVASRRDRPPESANQTLTVEPVEPVSP